MTRADFCGAGLPLISRINDEFKAMAEVIAISKCNAKKVSKRRKGVILPLGLARIHVWQVQELPGMPPEEPNSG